MIKLSNLAMHEHVLILPHIMPDGDTIGSSVALYHALKSLGKKPYIVLDDERPREIEQLGRDIIIGMDDFLRRKIDYTLAICVDMSDVERLRERKSLIVEKVVYNIDHHVSNTMYGNVNIVDTAAAATGEIIYQLIKSLAVDITPEIAEALYIAIVTDTGNFKYSSTTSRTLLIASELFAVPFDRERVIVDLYHSIPREKIALHAKALHDTRYFHHGKVALCSVSLAQIKAVGAVATHTEGLVESIRDIDGVELVILLKEIASDEIKISMRSLGEFNVSKIAVAHGGGGHVNAAGFTIHQPLDDATQYMIKSVIEQVCL